MPNWDEFKQKHVLNPNNHRDYESWDKREQNLWLRNRLAHFTSNPGQQFGRKNLNSVIIATSQEILEDFRNPGVKFENKEDFYWSNKRYPIWLFRKRGSSRNGNGAEEVEQYSVTKLHEAQGPLHFLARTDPRRQFAPIHYHAQSRTPDPTRFPRD